MVDVNLVCGSDTYLGAALLTGLAARASGVGMLTIAVLLNAVLRKRQAPQIQRTRVGSTCTEPIIESIIAFSAAKRIAERR